MKLNFLNFHLANQMPSYQKGRSLIMLIFFEKYKPWIYSANREKQEEKPFRFAFKNPQVRVRSKSGTGPTSRKNQTPRSKSGSNHKNPKPNTPSPEKNERRKRKRHRKKKKPTEGNLKKTFQLPSCRLGLVKPNDFKIDLVGNLFSESAA